MDKQDIESIFVNELCNGLVPLNPDLEADVIDFNNMKSNLLEDIIMGADFDGHNECN